MNSPVCPHSGAALLIRDAAGHVGHLCSGCDGLWLPKRYLAAVARERNFVAERFADLLAAQPHEETELPCPGGCGKLLRTTVKGVELDWCADWWRLVRSRRGSQAVGALSATRAARQGE